MADLRAFLAQNALKVENQKYVASKRFVDEKGKPIEWEIKSISADEDKALRNNATKRVPVKGKRGVTVPETDFNDYQTALMCASIVYPDLHNAELQNSYGVMTAEELLSAMLIPGELIELSAKIQEINGYDVEVAIEEAKN